MATDSQRIDKNQLGEGEGQERGGERQEWGRALYQGGTNLFVFLSTVPSTAGMQDPENGVQVVGLGASREAWPVRMAAVPVLLERGLAKRKPPQRLVS